MGDQGQESHSIIEHMTTLTSLYMDSRMLYMEEDQTFWIPLEEYVSNLQALRQLTLVAFIDVDAQHIPMTFTSLRQ